LLKKLYFKMENYLTKQNQKMDEKQKGEK